MMKHVERNMPDRGKVTDNLMSKNHFILLSLTLQMCFSSEGWPNKYAIGLICDLNDYIQLFWFAIVSRLRDQELCGEQTVDTKNAVGKKERQTS